MFQFDCIFIVKMDESQRIAWPSTDEPAVLPNEQKVLPG